MVQKRRAQNGSQNGSEAAVRPPDKEAFSLISNEKLIALYTNLLKCRAAAERLAGGPDEGRINAGLATGSDYEAGTVGVAIDLGPEDAVCAPHSGLLTGFSGGALVETILRAPEGPVWMGQLLRLSGRPENRNGASHARTSEAYPHAALGAALANKTKKNGKVAVMFATEGQSEPWADALKIASVHGLPMIFVSHERQDAGRRTRKGETPDVQKDTPSFPDIAVDSHDVVAVYRVANEAISRARQGRGPTLIECRPFPLNGKRAPTKNGNGDPSHTYDPILNMEHYLRGKGLLHPNLKSGIIAQFRGELESYLARG